MGMRTHSILRTQDGIPNAYGVVQKGAIKATQRKGIDTDFSLVSDELKTVGYNTAIVGKVGGSSDRFLFPSLRLRWISRASTISILSLSYSNSTSQRRRRTDHV